MSIISERLLRSVRVLRREHGFGLHAILILAVGIGATAAVFSLIQGALLESPPYADADELVVIGTQSTEGRPSFSNDAWAPAVPAVRFRRSPVLPRESIRSAAC